MKTHELIEALSRRDAAIKEHERVLRELKVGRAKLELKLLKAFAKGKIDTQRCGSLTAVRKESVFWSIKNRPKFLKFVVANEAYDLFQNRVSATALKERTENGEKVPGVEPFRKPYIALTKKR